jgi:hypothetical protein
MSEIAVINSSSMDDVDVEFAVEACDIQLREHLCPKWQGVSYTPVRFYASGKDLPVLEDICRLMVISDTLDVSGGAVAYHTCDPLIRGVVLAGDGMASRLSHECLEEAVDPTADKWIKMPDGKEVAFEVADPVEADEYPIPVTILGQTRQVVVSNFVLPSWFDTGAVAPFDYLGLLTEAFTLRPQSYMVVADADGTTNDIWGDQVDPMAAAATRARKVLNSGSRTYRRGLR